MKYEVKSEVKSEVRDVVSDWMGLNLTESQVDEILSVPSLRGEIEEWGVSDTVTREKIGDFLARKIVGRSWPMDGEDQKGEDDFYESFETRAKELGYQLVDSRKWSK